MIPNYSLKQCGHTWFPRKHKRYANLRFHERWDEGEWAQSSPLAVWQQEYQTSRIDTKSLKDRSGASKALRSFRCAWKTSSRKVAIVGKTSIAVGLAYCFLSTFCLQSCRSRSFLAKMARRSLSFARSWFPIRSGGQIWMTPTHRGSFGTAVKLNHLVFGYASVRPPHCSATPVFSHFLPNLIPAKGSASSWISRWGCAGALLAPHANPVQRNFPAQRHFFSLSLNHFPTRLAITN